MSQYAPAGVTIPPPPSPPWEPACPPQPAMTPQGWYFNAWIEPNTGTKLIVLGGERGTCFYVKHWTGSTTPAWVRYGTQGPWTVQGLYPLPAPPVARYRVEVYVPPDPNGWSRIVREVYPPEGGPEELPPPTGQQPNLERR